jgi:photosystem II stability/assembly factor-like uncharacterized protein
VSASNSATPCIYKSTDGVTWTGVFNSASTGYYLLRDVSYANGVWVAVGQSTLSPLLCTSTDGTTWTIKSTGITGNYQLHDVAYGNNKWIATSTSQQLVISTNNGSTWSASLPATLPASQYTAIGYADGVWVIALSNFIYRSLDNAVTWVTASINPDTYEVTGFAKVTGAWLSTGSDGDVCSSTDNGDNWYQVFLQGNQLNAVAIGGTDTKRLVIVGNSGYLATNYQIIDFDVHPMRVNLFTDPFFAQAPTIDGTWDNTSKIYRKATVLDMDGRSYGWGVHIQTNGTVTTSPTVTKTGETLTITLAAGVGLARVTVYSRGIFNTNPSLTYFGSVVTSRVPKLRFLKSENFPMLTVPNLESGTGAISFYDPNAGTGSYADSSNTGRTIVESAQPTDSSPVIPCFVYDLTLNASPTVITFEAPLVEYRNSSGEFFTGSTAMGGFIPNAAIEGNPSAGSYDYHWGSNASGTKDRDFSLYTLDFQRSKSVAIDVVSNYIMPVTLVKGVNYEINWEVLE